MSGYAGFEEELLAMRNANRDTPKTRQYLDWRYAQLAGMPSPRVFWLRARDRSAVGMASLIFRRYWVNGSPRDVPVLGDLSLDQRLRKHGLAQSLMSFIGRYLDRFCPQQAAFVMPTRSAERCLSASGWAMAGSLTPHVFVVDPTDILVRHVHREGVARCAAAVYRTLTSAALRMSGSSGASLEFVDDVDEEFDEFWRNLPKDHVTLCDRSAVTLRWRYIQHPDRHFKLAKFVGRAGLLGYVIFGVSPQDQMCHVYDLIVMRPRDLRPMLAKFVRHVQATGAARTIRLVLSDRHQYGRSLWTVGFVTRPAQGVFQLRTSHASASGAAWQVTLGDKDV